MKVKGIVWQKHILIFVCFISTTFISKILISDFTSSLNARRMCMREKERKKTNALNN